MTPEALGQQINTAWTLVAAFLVFFMQAGFGMLEAGAIRAKNNVNILLKNFMDFCIASVAFYFIGYAFMFGEGNGFIGTQGFLMKDLGAEAGGLPILAYWFFQVVFCGAAATIVAGAIAERTRFPAYLAYSFFVSALIYPIIGHWIWGGGWLAKLGMLDFAGSTVVHAVGGFASFAGLIVLGSRIGRWDGTRKFPASNIPLVALGVLLLWFGWFGFNGGSTLGMSDPALTAKVVVNTNAAAATGAIGALFLGWILYKRPDAMLTMNGILAGLVGITAGCAYVTPTSAMFIGIISSLVMVGGLKLLEKLRIDDAVGAIPVHAFGGVIGTILVGVFHTEQGLIATGSWKLLGIQTFGTLVSSAFVFVSMLIIFALIKAVIGLRVSKEVEEIGIDIGEHVLPSYPEFVFVSDGSPAIAPATARQHGKVKSGVKLEPAFQESEA
ncbi:ammonium transporter [Candidatus Peregrinibacteria bacterium]|nr:ammonium transporter [Candidatus Peregrinibacteria bacterium]